MDTNPDSPQGTPEHPQTESVVHEGQPAEGETHPTPDHEPVLSPALQDPPVSGSTDVNYKSDATANNTPATSNNAPTKPEPIPASINSTRVLRFAVLAAVKVLQRGRHHHFGNIVFLTDKLCVKYRPSFDVQTAEVHNLQFVAEHTSIPVPKAYTVFVHKGYTYIVMERIKGKALLQTWSLRSVASKARIFAQLKKMVNEMRALPPPAPGVYNVLGGPVYDNRNPREKQFGGPFESIHDFHLYLRNGNQDYKGTDTGLTRMFFLQDQPWPMPVFSHGDITPFNVLVRGDDIVGIVNWACAGWYPSYWEYTSAWHQGIVATQFWREQLHNFLEPFPDEVHMEGARLDYFSDW